jgi:hypothetical protein
MSTFKSQNTVKIFLLILGLVICQAAMAGKVSVKSADPSEGEQGTVELDVTIAGSGFDNSAQAVFLLTGTTNPGGVVVHSTAFVRSSKLVARISIDSDATLGDFDIEVQMSRGRGGKGTTLFRVLKNSGKPVDPVFTADSTDPYIPPIDSHDLGHDWAIVFRNADMDLTQFTGSWDSGGSCNHEAPPSTIVLKPKSKKNPLVARLEFWFLSSLESGDIVSHLFYMEGVFDEPDNWPPLDTDDPETTLTFNYWEVKAENKWAQRQDCAGEEWDPSGPWTVTVTRKPPTP